LFHRSTETAEPVVETHGHPLSVSLEERLREVEQGLIKWALTVSAGNKSKAAELLRIKRSTLGDRIKKLGLPNVGDDPAPGARLDLD
jgi:DNA-binding NtrC family response regulator